MRATSISHRRKSRACGALVLGDISQMLNSALSKNVIYGGASTPVFLDLLIMVSRCLIAGKCCQIKTVNKGDSPGAATGLR